MTGRRVSPPLSLLFPVLAVLSTACSRPEPVTVYAAASLSSAMEEAAAAFEKSTGIPVAVRTGSSGTLALDIENGAPADVFISAGEEWMTSLLQKKRLDTNTRRLVAWNQLVLVVPNSAVAPTPRALAYLNILETIAMGDPDAVPLGTYTKQSLEELGLWLPLRSRIVYARNARATLALVERREVQGAFVYASDARGSDKVKVALEIPEEAHDPIVYVGAVVAASPRHEQAFRFLKFLTGPETTEILRSYGLGGR